MIVIGIHGKKHSGKDECYLAIKNYYSDLGLLVERVAFADSCYEEVAKAYGVSVEYIKQHKENFRLIMQGHGTDYRRKLFSDNYWIEKVLNKLLQAKADVVVLPDVRFVNEYLCIRDMDGFVWKVTRPLSSNDMHVSETELDTCSKWDVEINNDTTLARLHKEVEFRLHMNNYALSNRNIKS